MSLTKPVNSKSNIKQFTDADLPFSPRQPVIARYAAESTLNQTVITLPFQIDTVNAADSFILTVDGKVLTPGATNDYQFSGVDSFGFTNSVTLNYGLSAGLNIQGIKLGLKKETDFLQDARFTQVYEGLDQGFQGFIRTSDLMVATASAGAPGSGQFYSSIQNRAAMPDLRTDLKARMGIERIAVQNIYPIQNETGPNGEIVWGIANDLLGQVRLVGNWNTVVTNNGSRPQTTSGLTTDFIEITFYGTGLNIGIIGNVSSRTHVYSVDGGAESSNFYPTVSGVIDGRNYTSNTVIPVVSGLALGVHTVKIRNTNASQNMDFSVIEILNETLDIRVNPGVGYLAGKKITSSLQSAIAYNSSFESGALGTRGGRVVVYQKSDGTIGKAVQPTGSQLNLASADHTNEEIVRAYHFREFGAARSDDFSSLTTTSSRTFTLDDGTTSLVGTSVVVDSAIGNGFYSNASSYFVFTFVGTGLDLITHAVATPSAPYTINVDGTDVVVASTTYFATAGRKIVKIASGLPYGTHTVRVTRTNVGNAITNEQFIVYQPKKPSIPAGAVELADYNVMADYVAATATTEYAQRSTGTLAKTSDREFLFVGAGWAIAQAGEWTPSLVTSSTAGNYFEYTFFGTGINIISRSAGVASTATVQIDGAAYTGAATTVGSGNSWTPGTSTFTMGAAANSNGQLQISGLSLGKHTIRVTVVTNSTRLYGVEIITPVYSAKSDFPVDLQNSLSVGSNAISDNRNIYAVKSQLTKSRPVVRVYGNASVSTTVSSYITIPDMSATVICANDGEEFEIQFEGNFSSNTNGTRTFFQVTVDGIVLSPVAGLAHPSTINYNVHLSAFVTLSKGAHKIDIVWATDGSGTRSRNNTESAMFIKKVN